MSRTGTLFLTPFRDAWYLLKSPLTYQFSWSRVKTDEVHDYGRHGEDIHDGRD